MLRQAMCALMTPLKIPLLDKMWFLPCMRQERTRTLRVTKPFTPLACRYAMTSASSPSSKLAALARALKPPARPKYTASAPFSTAQASLHCAG